HLREHDWPGNVRELAHFAERFVLGLEEIGSSPAAQPTDLDVSMPLPERLERYEAEIIRETLGRNGGDVRRTIEALGIPRKTFYDKLQRHGIVRSDFSREIKLVEPDRSPRR
ncbi:helix-turn-helix domain-containing protein, partial [Mesorhizobium sp.]